MPLSDWLTVVPALILGFGAVIFIHELGHFLLARWNGIRVETFSIGFGPTLWARKIGDTEYRLALLPLGGYVKMTGEDPEDAAGSSAPDGFAKQSILGRASVVVAGPVMNFLFALVLLPIVFMVGRERPVYELNPPIIERIQRNTGAALAGLQPGDKILAVNWRNTNTWEGVQDAVVLSGTGDIDLSIERAGAARIVKIPQSAWGLGIIPLSVEMNAPTIDAVDPGTPASAAGVRAGDRVVRVGGIAVEGWDELYYLLGAGRNPLAWSMAHTWWGGDFAVARKYVHGAPLALDVRGADGAARTAQIEPRYSSAARRYVIGVRHDAEAALKRVPTHRRQYDVATAVIRGWKEFGRLSGLTLDFLGRLADKPTEHYTSLAGPVRVISAFADIAREGLAPYLFFLAFFNIQLGLLNLLPIPVLDGGHLFFLAIEAIIRRPLTLRLRVIATNIGLVFLLSVFAIVTFQDLASFAWIRKLFGQ